MIMSLFKFVIRYTLIVLVTVTIFSLQLQAQETQQESVSPRGAFLRSVVMPGWGHYYVDHNNWTRGQYHLAADVTMILAYAGISMRNNTLEDNLITYVNSNAGINLDGRGKNIYLAISEFDNLQEYNDYQLISRNWDNLLDQTAENDWNWQNEDARYEYQDMRKRIDRSDNQLPALITLMVVNRLVSGISAVIKANHHNDNLPEASFSYLNEFGEPGMTAHLKVAF